jgi:hypothetical protein
MRRLLLAAAGAMALVGGAAANAGPVISGPVGPLPPAVTTPGTFIIGSNLSAGPGTFSDMFTFTILGTAPELFNGQVTSQEFPSNTNNINFTSLLLDGVSVFTKTSSDPNPESWSILNPILLSAGSHTITVGGTLNGTVGSYVGNFNVAAAVPEPATWAMMLLGFGAMGMVIRRRRKPVLAQLA